MILDDLYTESEGESCPHTHGDDPNLAVTVVKL